MSVNTSANPNPNDEFVSTAEAAVMCGVQPRTVAQWRTTARAQPLPFHRVGGKRLYRKADVIAFIDAGRHQPAKD